jgi:hypothetical protein
MEEIYSYLGSIDVAHFFIHLVVNDEFKDEISHQIMNVMIDDKAIKKDEIVIIHEINKVGKTKYMCIRHMDREDITLSTNYLKETYDRIVKPMTYVSYAISYDYNTKVYKTYLLDDPIAMANNVGVITTEEIVYVGTYKKIDYTI